jgi:hypothetical protein
MEHVGWLVRPLVPPQLRCLRQYSRQNILTAAVIHAGRTTLILQPLIMSAQRSRASHNELITGS